MLSIVPWDGQDMLSPMLRSSFEMPRSITCSQCPHWAVSAAVTYVSMVTARFTAGNSGRMQMSVFAAALLACCLLLCSRMPVIHDAVTALSRTVR